MGNTVRWACSECAGGGRLLTDWAHAPTKSLSQCNVYTLQQASRLSVRPLLLVITESVGSTQKRRNVQSSRPTGSAHRGDAMATIGSQPYTRGDPCVRVPRPRSFARAQNACMEVRWSASKKQPILKQSANYTGALPQPRQTSPPGGMDGQRPGGERRHPKYRDRWPRGPAARPQK